MDWLSFSHFCSEIIVTDEIFRLAFFFFYNYKKVGLTSYKSFSNYFFFYLHNVSMFCSLFPKTVPSILDPFMGVLVYLLFRAHDYEIFRLVNTSVTNFFIILKGKNEMVFFMSVLMSLFKMRQKRICM